MWEESLLTFVAALLGAALGSVAGTLMARHFLSTYPEDTTLPLMDTFIPRTKMGPYVKKDESKGRKPKVNDESAAWAKEQEGR